MTADRAEARRGLVPRKPHVSKDKTEARRFVQVKTVVMMSDAWRDCDLTGALRIPRIVGPLAMGIRSAGAAQQRTTLA